MIVLQVSECHPSLPSTHPSSRARFATPHHHHHQGVYQFIFCFSAECIKDRQDHILRLLDMHCGGGQEGVGGAKEDSNPGYLLLMKCNFCDEKDLNWSGDTIHVKPTAETTISLSQIEVSSISGTI